jgi:lactaldehyde dehydrogenase / glycolaldehyde dehydrogenase
MPARVIDQSLFIGGAFRAASGDGINVINPSNEDVLATVLSATAAEVGAAVAAANEARKGWAQLPSAARGRHLRQLADLIEAHKDHLAKLLVRETGKPASLAAGEVDAAANFLRYNAEWDRRIEGEVLPGEVAGEVINLLRAPVGVVAAICPWNGPLAVLCRKLGPALVTGNTVVAKPSEISPLATLELFRLLGEHLDLPPGVVNLVTGAAATGSALVIDEGISMVSFTGHRDTGKSIMRAAAPRLTRVALELGGKAPAIVWRDADLGLAVSAIVTARHRNSGQVCTSAERVFVHEEVFEPFVKEYVAAVEALRVGDPFAAVDMGPLASAAQFEKSTAAVTTALEEGARVITGGGRPKGAGFARGYWFQPTVLQDVEPTMRVMREETFGPITPVMPVDSLDQALGVANDSRYGLSAYVFSRDYRAVMASVEDLEFGEIYVNRTLGESRHAHHSGFRESGIGGEDGKWGLLRYTQIKTVYHRFG